MGISDRVRRQKTELEVTIYSKYTENTDLLNASNITNSVGVKYSELAYICCSKHTVFLDFSDFLVQILHIILVKF